MARYPPRCASGNAVLKSELASLQPAPDRSTMPSVWQPAREPTLLSDKNDAICACGLHTPSEPITGKEDADAADATTPRRPTTKQITRANIGARDGWIDVHNRDSETTEEVERWGRLQRLKE